MSLKSFIHGFSILLAALVPVFGHPADPNSLLSKYSLYGEDSLVFKDAASTADNGWIGSALTVQLTSYGQDTIGGKIKAGKDFIGSDVGSNTTVYGDTIFVDKDGSWSGDYARAKAFINTEDVASPTWPKFSAANITVGTVSINSSTFSSDSTVLPGRYKKIESLNKTQKLVFKAGVYEIDTLIVGENLIIDKDSASFCRIMVKSLLDISEKGVRGYQIVEKNNRFGRVLIYAASSNVTLGDNIRVDATILAPNADVTARTGMMFNGQLMAKSITITNGFSGNTGAFYGFQSGDLQFPDSISKGVSEDLTNNPKIPNSRLLTFPLKLGAPSDTAGKIECEILTTSTQQPSAEHGVDFSTSSNGAVAKDTINFAKGDTISSDLIKIWVEDDDKVDSTEYITVRLRQIPGQKFDTGDPFISFENGLDTIDYQIHLINEDTDPTFSYEKKIVCNDMIVPEDPKNEPLVDNSYTAVIPVKLAEKPVYAGSVHYEILKVSPKSPAAQNDSDFTIPVDTGTIQFSSGDSLTTDSIRIRILDDALYEPSDEFVAIRFSNPVNTLFSNGKSDDTTFIAIQSEDTLNNPPYKQTVIFPDTIVAEDLQNDPGKNNSRTIAIPLNLTGKTAYNGSVNYTILNSSSKIPAAELNRDFRAPMMSGTASFPLGSTGSTDSIKVEILDDTEDDSLEYVEIQLSAPNSVLFANGKTVDTCFVRIDDEDTAGTLPYMGEIVFPSNILDGVDEDTLKIAGEPHPYLLSFPLSLNISSPKQAASVNYEILAVADSGTAAIDGVDFNRSKKFGADSVGTLTFANGSMQSRESIRIWIEDDYDVEPNETITIRLSSPDSVTFANGQETIVYRIPLISEDTVVNGDSTVTPDYRTISVPVTSVNESVPGNSHLVKFPLTLNKPTLWNGTIQYEILDSAKVVPAATKDADFYSDLKGAKDSGSIHFAINQSSSSDSIAVWIVDDAKVESDEFITIRLFNPDSVNLSQEFYSFKIISEDIVTDTTDTTGTIDPRTTISGFATDTTGDGIGDKITMTIDSVRTVSDIISVNRTWNGGVSKSIPDSLLIPVDLKTVSWSDSVSGFGSGTVTVRWKGDSLTTTGTLSDSIGAALVSGSASLKKGRLADTVLFVASETITVPVDSCFFLYESGTVAPQKVKPIEIQGADSQQFTAIFTPGTIKQGMYANFNSGSANPVIDRNGNKPLSINQKVRLGVDMGTKPTFNSGAIFDVFPSNSVDGYGDSGSIVISIGEDTAALTMDSLTSITIGGKTVSNWIVADSDAVRPTEIHFRDTTLTGITDTVPVVLTFGTITINGTVADKIGAALVSGSADLRDANRLSDDIHFEITEMVATPQLTTFLLYDDSVSAAAVGLKPDSIDSIGANIWKASYPKGTITQGLWANLATTTTPDQYGNKPDAANHKIQLDVKLGREPGFRSGALFDRIGTAGRLDGFGDSAVVRISLGPDSSRMTMDTLTAITIGTVSVPKSNWKIENDSVVTFKDSTLTSQKLTGKTTAVLKFGTTYALNCSLADSVAPVASEAIYEKWPDGDTLQVTFTEAIGQAGNTAPFNFFSGTALGVSASSNLNGVVRYHVNSGEIGSGDSLWISKNGGVGDVQGNIQRSDSNTHVPVKLLQVVTPVAAWLSDESVRPDGIADQLTLVTSNPMPKTLITPIGTALTLPADRGTVAAAGAVVSGDTIRFNLIGSAVVATGSRDSDQLGLTGQVRMSDTLFYFPKPIQLLDRMAPVQVSASYRFGPESTGVKTVADTLVIRYSEPVKPIEVSSPFDLKGSKGEYTLTLVPDQTGGDSVAYVRIFAADSTLPAENDSLWIRATGLITDTVNNVQERDTRAVALTVPVYQSEFTVTVYPNPVKLDPHGQFVNEYLKKLGKNHSQVSVIVTPVGIRPASSSVGLTARIAMRDPVGNRIFDLEDLTPIPGLNHDQIFTFDLKNQNDRRLSSGIYLLVTELSGETNLLKRMSFGVAETVVDGQVIRE